MIATRRVQTNEVGRCSILLAGFAAVQQVCRTPLYLIDVGASAGLNLLFDRFRYEFSDGRVTGGPSPVVIRTELRGEKRPQKLDFPEVAGRVGVDWSPIDVADPAAMRWLEALIWPDEIQRIERHRQAAALARTAPPRLVQGDGLETVPALVAAVSDGQFPCIYHSYALYQQTEDQRSLFEQMLTGLGAMRDLAWISLEWLGNAPGAQLEMTCWLGGRPHKRLLADTHSHGRWITWIDEPVSAG